MVSKQKTFSTRKFLLIGATIFSSKVALLVIAYFFNKVQYNTFNQAYYTASILILFGELGLQYSINKIRYNIKIVFTAVFINILIAFTVLYFISSPGFSFSQMCSVFLYGLFACIGGIYSFQLLFKGYYNDYFIQSILFAVLHLAIIPLVKIFNADIFLVLPFVTFFWLLISYPRFLENKETSLFAIKNFYSIGISSFIINSSVPFALVIDKYYVNHFFSIESANSYTFAWVLTAPLFYIGNLVERLIYSAKETKGREVIKKSFLLNFTLTLIYAIVLIIFVNKFPQYLPSSVDKILLQKIFLFMMPGYSIYVIFHFPINGFLFKYSTSSKQKKIAFSYTVIVLILIGLYLILNGEFTLLNYKTLLLVIWSFIFTLLIIKTTILFGSDEEYINVGNEKS